jgi:hypothetical protein
MSLEARLRPRLLSHLAIYRRTMTMMSSMAHRLTAAANVPLALLLIAFVVALTSADYANLANGGTMQLIPRRIYHDFDPKTGEEYELRGRLFRTGRAVFRVDGCERVAGGS